METWAQARLYCFGSRKSVKSPSREEDLRADVEFSLWSWRISEGRMPENLVS